MLIGGCAHHYTEATVSDPYGFFWGIWHGVVFWFALLANIVSWLLALIGIDLLSDIQFVGRPNTGTPYYIGFTIGLLGSSGSGGRAATSSDG